MAVKIGCVNQTADFGVPQQRGLLSDSTGMRWTCWSTTTNTGDTLIAFPNIARAIAIQRAGESIEDTARRALDRAEGKDDAPQVGFVDMTEKNLIETQPIGRGMLAIGMETPNANTVTDGGYTYLFFPFIGVAGACKLGEAPTDAAARIWQAHLDALTNEPAPIAVVPPQQPTEREILDTLTPSRFLAWLLQQPLEASTGVSWDAHDGLVARYLNGAFPGCTFSVGLTRISCVRGDAETTCDQSAWVRAFEDELICDILIKEAIAILVLVLEGMAQ